MLKGGEARKLAHTVTLDLPVWEANSITKALTVTEDVTINPEHEDSILLIVEKEAIIHEEGSGTYDITIYCKENVSVKYYSISENNIVTRTGYLLADSSIDWVDVALAGGTSHVTSYLVGKGSHAEFQSVFLGVNAEQYDVKSNMIHYGDKSTSNMKTRSVMLDNSHGRYEGLIHIDKNAAGCDAYQKEDTLLLSPNATMDATPNLEISNEDVRCSHGVSLSQLDDEKIFYFRSRGIEKADAINLIIHGFFDEILDRMGSHAKKAREQLFERMRVRV